MKAVLLAGGLGTRFAEETDTKPKPMIEIGGMPILWHIMKIYSHHGINEFIICLGYKGYVIKEYFQNYFLHMSDVTFDMHDNTMEVHNANAEPWRVTLVDTGEKTMIGGRIKRILPYPRRRQGILPDLWRRRRRRRRPRGDRPSPQGRAPGDGDRHPAARAVRRDQVRGSAGHGFPGKADGRRRLDQRRLFRLVARGRPVHRGRRYGLGTRADASGWRPMGSSASISIPASGSRWTRCETSDNWRISGRPARRRGNSGE